MTRVLAVVLLTSAAAAADPVVRPRSQWDDGYYGRATPGDSVLYVDARGNPVSRTLVDRISDGDRQVELSVVRYSMTPGVGNTVTQEVLQFTGDEPPKPAGRYETRRTEVVHTAANGLRWRCVLWEYLRTDGPDKGQVFEKAWYSPQVPFDGLVRRETAGGVVEIQSAIFSKAPRTP